MVETVKLTEVTDVVTPAEETTPKNYNFSMESTWEETIFSQGGGDEPTGTKEISITENGTTTEDVTDYANAQITVNVPQGITPSGSQTFTENGTYDVTSLAEAVVNVAGAEYYTGTIELSDTDAATISLPVSVGANDEFLFEFYLTKTGTVSGGVVTYDSELSKHSTFELITNGVAKKYRSATILTNGGRKPMYTFCFAYGYSATNNSAQTTNDNGADAIALGANAITITPSSTTKRFCVAGEYYAFTYHVYVARGV